jgi:threonine dehydrogenase-like Zn-dependent dehydrogenase
MHGFERVVVWGAGPVGKAFARELGELVVAFVDVDPRKIGKTIYGARVVVPDDAPQFSDAFAIGAVAGEEARAEIRATVATQGRSDGVDLVAVA